MAVPWGVCRSLASLLSNVGRWDEFLRVEGDLRARTDFPESIRERFYR